MPIYNTNTFWNYIANEPLLVMKKCKDLLTRTDYNFDTKMDEISKYYTVVSKIELDDGIHEVLRFPSGLLKYMREKAGIPVEDKNRDYVTYTKQDILKYADIVKEINPHFEIREYQIKAVLASLDKFASLITAGTGSGKTSIMSLLCKVLEKDKILILNNNNFILQQIYERLLSFGIEDISWNPSKDPDYSKRIVILNTSSSDSRLNKQDINYLEYLKKVNVVIWDEAHGVQALTYFEPLFYTDIENLKHIIGYTATPFRKYKGPYSDPQDFRLISILGEPVFSYDLKNSIEDGNVAQPYAYFINFPNKASNLPAQFKDNYYMQYRSGITYNKARNKAGLEMLKFLNKNGIKTMASFNNIKPGQNLLKALKEEGIDSLFICGGETVYEWVYNKKGKLVLETRSGNVDTIKEALRDKYNIIISSKVFDAGVDIDIFQAVVLFSAGKTPIAGLQRVGRASRKKVNGINVALAIDFKDINGFQVLHSHYQQRKQLMVDSGVIILDNVYAFMDLVTKIKESKEES